MKMSARIAFLIFFMTVLYTSLFSFFIANFILFFGKQNLWINLTIKEFLSQYFVLLNYNLNHIYGSFVVVVCMLTFGMFLLKKGHCKKKEKNDTCS